MLGRVLVEGLRENGRSLEDVSRPNDCVDKLGARTEEPLVRTFENAQQLAGGGKAQKTLGMFGLEEDAQAATHLYYKLDVEKRAMRAATPDYTACCKDKGTCGFGFVSGLAYGEGQYATAEGSSADGSFDLPASGEPRGFVRVRILHKRNIYGYVAAFVTVTSGGDAKAMALLGDPAAAKAEPDEHDLPPSVKARFEAQRIQVAAKDPAPAPFACTSLPATAVARSRRTSSSVAIKP